MVVRTAQSDDALAIARVQVASWQTAYRGLIPAARLAAFTVEVREVAWRRNLTTVVSGRRTTVFERAGEVTGFATTGPSRDEPRVGELWALYVAPDSWGHGVGSALMADALVYLTPRWPTVTLWVLEGNRRAIGFYEGSGFELDGNRVVRDGLAELRMRRG